MVLALSFGVTASAHAAVLSMQTAISVLGQDDGDVTSPAPIFNKGAIHDAAHKHGLSGPVMGMALDPTDHKLFLSDTVNNRVLVYNLDSSNNLLDRIPDNVLGQINFYFNTLGTTQIGLNAPNGIAFDDTNNRLFIADTTNNRIEIYNTTTITDGMKAVNVLGQSTFTVLTAATTQVGLNVPTGVAYDSTNQRLFVAQNTGNRVTVFDVVDIADGEPAIKVLGQVDFVTATAGTTQTTMSLPFGVAYHGATNRLFVSEGTNNRILVFSGATTALSNGMAATKELGQAAGGTAFTTGAVGTTQATLSGPRGITYDATRNLLFVAEVTNNRVMVFSGSVALLSNGMNASNVLGQVNFATATAGSTQAGMNVPTGVLMDETNNRLYVPQSTGNRVTIYNLTPFSRGQNAADALGQYDDTVGTPGPIYTKVTANDAPNRFGMSAPQGVTVDSVNHRLFVADSTNNRVLVYNLDSNDLPLDLIPDNVLGQANFYTNAVGSTQTTLSAPTGLAFDLGRNLLFVSDMTNNRILVYDTSTITNGKNAMNVLGQATFVAVTAGTTQFGVSAPRQLEYDGSTKLLYVADTANNRVIAYDLTSITDSKFAATVIGQTDGLVSSPQPIYVKGAVNDGPNKSGLSGPTGLVMDATDHRLFVSDGTNNRVLVYNLDSSNNLLDRIPDNVLGQANFYTSTVASTRPGTNAPAGLSYDDYYNRLFVVQSTGNRVSVFDVTTITDGMDATNVLGQINYTTVTAATTQVGLNVPTDAYYDQPTGRLFVPQNTGNRVTIFNLTGGLADNMNADNGIGQYNDNLSAPAPIYTKTTAHNGPNKLGLSAPIIGMALDTTNHRLFLSDTSNNRVLVYNIDSSNNLSDRIPDNVLGEINFYTNAVATTQIGMSAPNGLAFDSVGNRLFVVDTTNNRVKIYDTASITDGENAVNVLGQASFTTSAAATTQVGLNVPTGVAYDSATGRLFVAQNTGNRVSVFSGSVALLSMGMNATKEIGQPSGAAAFTSATAATTQAGLNVPYDVAYDSATSRLFVSQGTANRISVFSGSVTLLSNGMNATKEIGQPSGAAAFTSAAAATTQAGLSAPRGIRYDGTRNWLYVAETTNNRLMVFSGSVALLSNGMNATQVLGQANFTTATAGNTQAGMNAPNGVLVDETNNRVYVSQSGNHRVTIFNAPFTKGQNAADDLGQYDDSLTVPLPIYTKTVANNGPNILGLSAPVIGMALDPTDHRLFVSDTGNNRVLVYNLNSSDLLVDRIPDFVIGQANFYTNAAATTQAGLNVPNGIAYHDATDRLFVVQGTANRVSVFTGSVAGLTNGENATKEIGQAAGASAFTSATAATTQAGLNVPFDVMYHSATDRLFVSQGTSNRVTVYSGSVALLSNGMNATKEIGQPSGAAAFTSATAATTQAGLSSPRGLAYDGTRNLLFVSDTTNNRVLTYSGTVALLSNGMNASQVLGQANFITGTLGNTQVGMNDPRGIAYDGTNNRLFVSQATGNRVTIYNLTTIQTGQNALNVLGQPNFTTITAGVFQEGLNAPTGVLVDPTHTRAYVLDSTTNRVLSYNLTLGIGNGKNAYHVLGQTVYNVATAGTTQSTMTTPYAVGYDSPTNRLFIAEAGNNRVLVFSGSVALLSDGMNATKEIGQAAGAAAFTTATANTTQAGLNVPRGIHFDDTHSLLYVSQFTGNRVSVFSGSVAQLTNGMNAIKVLGQPIFTSLAAVSNQAGLNGPNAIFVDEPNNKLYVSQATGNRVSVFDVATIADGEGAVDVIGEVDDTYAAPGPAYLKSTANNGSNRVGLSSPQGLALDTTNNRLFVSDTVNNRILEYDLTSGHLPSDYLADHVLGQPLYWLNAVGTTQFSLSSPTGLAFDPTGNTLFVSDFTNNRIMVYDTASITDGEYATQVLGQPTFLVATAGITQVGLSSPRQIVYDRTSGKLFVADTANNRAVIYDVNHSGDNTTNKFFYFFGF